MNPSPSTDDNAWEASPGPTSTSPPTSSEFPSSPAGSFHDVELPSSRSTTPPPTFPPLPVALPSPDAPSLSKPDPLSITPISPIPLATNLHVQPESSTPVLSGPPTDFDLSLKSPEGFGSFDSDGGTVLGVLLVNFNHLLGPVIDFSYPPDILSSPSLDPEISRNLPFLALPDGAHLQDEDYSYFHLTSAPRPNDPPAEDEPFPIGQTVFGISCNRQLKATELINKPADVTRSTVQMAVVVLARQPVFGPIRDKLGVVTRAFFAQRDFTSTGILVDFYLSLRSSMVGKVSEATMHMGTSLRELIKKFRYRTLVLLKLMLLQKKIMFFGYPVERLCTYQYTLVSLIPGLLMNLSDCGSPAFDTRSADVQKPTSLKTSDRASMLRFFGFPLNLFGEDAFFQPYLPLQQIDLCKSSSWLVGSTNQIMLQQRDAQYDCLVNLESTSFEFPDAKLERLVALTGADRKWMDDLVSTVEETWNPADPTRPLGMAFKGSDDYLRAKFEEYLCSVLSSMKYAEFAATSPNSIIVGSNPQAAQTHFSLPWLKALSTTAAFQQWDKRTDPVLFDIWEPAHPGRATNTATDIGLRLAETVHDLHIEQNLAPAREAISSALQSGSTSFLRAFEGVRAGFASQLAAQQQPTAGSSLAATTSSVSTSSTADLFGDASGPSSSFVPSLSTTTTSTTPASSTSILPTSIALPTSPLFSAPTSFFSRVKPAATATTSTSHPLSEGPSMVEGISERFSSFWGSSKKKIVEKEGVLGEEEMVVVDLDARREASRTQAPIVGPS